MLALPALLEDSGESLSCGATEAEAEVVAPVRRVAVVAVRGTAVPGVVVPAAATIDAVRPRGPSDRVSLRPRRVVAPPIKTPLPHVPVHVVESPCVRSAKSNFISSSEVTRHMVIIVYSNLAHCRILPPILQILAVVECRRRTGTTGIFPQRFCWEIKIQRGTGANLAKERIGINLSVTRPVRTDERTANILIGNLQPSAR